MRLAGFLNLISADPFFYRMNVIILAAGYATRLYPLTLTKAKPLLEVAGKPMMEWVLDHLAPVKGIETVYVVTNRKFAADFEEWAESFRKIQPDRKFVIIDDGSTNDADKLGAIGDINLVIEREGLEKDDLLVVAGDNLFSESLEGFVEFSRKHEAVVATFDVGDLEAIKKYNNLTLGSDGRVVAFEEKPANPTGTITAIALYYYSKATVPLVKTYIQEGNNPDQPGRFVQWLYTRIPVITYPCPGEWLDIGSRETLDEANAKFEKMLAAKG